MGERLIKVFATGLGTGYSPFAPGTAGTVIGIPVYLVFSRFHWALHAISIIALFFLAVYVSQEAENLFQQKDASKIVIDEIVGFQVTMFLISPAIIHIVLGFIAFRFFDIIKPFPIRLCEKKFSGGYGVVMDDVMAGIYGNIIVMLLINFTGI